MQFTGKPLAAMAVVVIFAAFGFSSPRSSTKRTSFSTQQKESRKIQVAILLDVSGSMQGLIEQAKAQLWNMVTTLGKTRCTDKSAPQIELALYEYGRSSNDVAKGYVKQLSPFTTDLDQVSKILFSLSTNGGDEYCGQVIYTSLDELNWNPSPDNYKVIFIAGNEDFLQGKLNYTTSCTKAKEKGVIVNTIYCGDYQTGIAEHWNLGGECGNGSFTHINHNAREADIPTPYDSMLIVLNGKLNKTYIGYGALGFANTTRQEEVDQMNFSVNKSVAAKRINAKAQKNVYNNASWDLVDATTADSTYITKVDIKTLPDTLKNKSREQLRQIVSEKANERNFIQKEIATVSISRDKFIALEKAKTVSGNNQQTLETEVEKIIKEQVKRYKMVIE
ncbi:MAG: vWA domain-containing protein [Chitinophagaceae bacterium]